MSSTLEELPVSPYTRELERGGGQLRFAGPLETEFRRAHLRWARLRVRTWLTWASLMAVAIASLQLRDAGIAHPLSVATLIQVPCAFVLLWLAWSRRYERNYLAVAQVLVPILSALDASFLAFGYAAGHHQDIAERLRERVQNLVIRPPDPERRLKPDVTISVGVAYVTPMLGRTAAGIVQLADEALYEAKAAGRNCMVLKATAAYRGLDTGAFKSTHRRRKA